MAENEDIYKPVAKTQGGSGEEELKRRNKKSKNRNSTDLYEQNEPEIIGDSAGITNRMSLILSSDEDKTRRERENIRIRQEERNAGLRTDSNGDTVTKRGNIIHDRDSQSIEKWKQDIEKHKKSERIKIKESKNDKEERVKK